MKEVFAKNLGALITLLLIGGGLIATWVKFGTRITHLEAGRVEDKRVIESLAQKVQDHQANTALHIDPERDKEKWIELVGEMRRGFEGVTQRFDTTDRKIERILKES